MTLLNKIIDLLNTSPDDDKLYLIEKCSDVAGFFVCILSKINWFWLNNDGLKC